MVDLEFPELRIKIGEVLQHRVIERIGAANGFKCEGAFAIGSQSSSTVSHLVEDASEIHISLAEVSEVSLILRFRSSQFRDSTNCLPLISQCAIEIPLVAQYLCNASIGPSQAQLRRLTCARILWLQRFPN